MLFNSLDFAVFLPLVFIMYWVFRNSLKTQNVIILLSSYIFYAWWDYRFLSLIVFSTLVDYFVGKSMKSTPKQNHKKALLFLSLGLNLGLLGFFKYYNFFIESWIGAWSLVGINMSLSTMQIILPVGISFYTFQTLSYTIDVYRGKIEPTNSLLRFAAYVSFFPQLVAGPIERAKHLLPQFEVNRKFDYNYAMSGFYLIIWGLFKKVVVADNCAFFVNQIFDGHTNFSSIELFIGAVLFGFQIYGDFSGYSDIAIGVARLFGFSLMVNFSFPYFSRDIAEFWRRWHISLSTWFRDYLYIPLGGSRGKKWIQIRNVFVVFLVSGFWHGANWTFIIWGLIHAVLFLPLFVLNVNRTHVLTTKFKVKHVPSMFLTFFLVTIAWIFFRAVNVEVASTIIFKIIQLSDISIEVFYKTSKALLFTLIIVFGIITLLIFEYNAVQKNYKEVKLKTWSAVVISTLIVFMGVFKNPSDFIYFQF